MAPHAALAEADAEYALALVAEDDAGHRPAEYLSLNPWGQVPTLEDGDLVLTESVAIMLHLADRFPTPVSERLSEPLPARSFTDGSHTLRAPCRGAHAVVLPGAVHD